MIIEITSVAADGCTAEVLLTVNDEPVSDDLWDAVFPHTGVGGHCDMVTVCTATVLDTPFPDDLGATHTWEG